MTLNLLSNRMLLNDHFFHNLLFELSCKVGGSPVVAASWRPVGRSPTRVPQGARRTVGGSVEATWVAAAHPSARWPLRAHAHETVHVPRRDPFDACGHDRVSF
jgi:hypothetical protein